MQSRCTFSGRQSLAPEGNWKRSPSYPVHAREARLDDAPSRQYNAYLDLTDADKLGAGSRGMKGLTPDAMFP